MPKYKINYGFITEDEYEEVIEAESLEAAVEEAYNRCYEAFMNSMCYSAEEIDED